MLRATEIDSWAGLSDPPNFPSGAMTDSADGFRSNNYKTRDNVGMMSSSGSGITLYQDVTSAGNITVHSGKKIYTDSIHTDTLKARDGSYIHVESNFKVNDGYELDADQGAITHLKTNNISADTGTSLNINNWVKLPSSLDPLHPMMSMI